MPDQTRGTIRLVPVATFDVYDGETQIGRINTDHNPYDGTVRFQAITWAEKAKSELFPTLPEALAWIEQQVSA